MRASPLDGAAAWLRALLPKHSEQQDSPSTPSRRDTAASIPASLSLNLMTGDVPSGPPQDPSHTPWHLRNAEDECRDVARAHASGRPALLLVHASGCDLCKSLHPVMEDVRAKFGDFVSIGRINSDHKFWAPEVITYDVQRVPTLVLVDARGRAICKTAAPVHKRQMEEAMIYMVSLAKELGGR